MKAELKVSESVLAEQAGADIVFCPNKEEIYFFTSKDVEYGFLLKYDKEKKEFLGKEVLSDQIVGGNVNSPNLCSQARQREPEEYGCNHTNREPRGLWNREKIAYQLVQKDP